MIRAAPDVSAARSRESAVNASPFGTCTARHEKLGLSAVNRPSSREAARTSSFDNPPRRRGEITPSSASARKPGRFAGIIGGVRAVDQHLAPVARHALENSREDERLASIAAIRRVFADVGARQDVGVYQPRNRLRAGLPSEARPQFRTQAETPCARRTPSPGTPARNAAASKYDESHPPENATATRGVRAKKSSKRLDARLLPGPDDNGSVAASALVIVRAFVVVRDHAPPLALEQLCRARQFLDDGDMLRAHVFARAARNARRREAVRHVPIVVFPWARNSSW